MNPKDPPVVILGGGPAGLAAAYKLSSRGWHSVTVLERGPRVGGNAGSFVIEGIPVDFGSHRLHRACPPAVLGDVRSLLGGDLLDRVRHGRIHLRGRWVHFPLQPVDAATRLPPGFIGGVLIDTVRKRFADVGSDPTFASILERGLGRTICRDFYFPYAEKIWGLPAAMLDGEQARRRVAAGSLGKMVRRLLEGASPSGSGRGRFFYPRHGYGQISRALHDAAVSSGARILLNATVTGVQTQGDRVVEVEADVGGERRSFPAAQVLSTIPISLLARLVRSDEPAPIEASSALAHRAMILVYLSLGLDRFSEFDAHYFPDAAIRITRLSEPKNYSLTERPGRTVLCAELPCATSDAEWSMDNEALGRIVCRDLERAGLGCQPHVVGVHVERLSHAYPLYTRGYRHAFDAIDRWVQRIHGLVTFGRQGLFVHDNTHHTMAMAYALVDCLRPDGELDQARWTTARADFESHVVED